jgi:hypothetical protein
MEFSTRALAFVDPVDERRLSRFNLIAILYYRILIGLPTETDCSVRRHVLYMLTCSLAVVRERMSGK